MLLRSTKKKNNIETTADILDVYYPRHVIINTINKYYFSSNIDNYLILVYFVSQYNIHNIHPRCQRC